MRVPWLKFLIFSLGTFGVLVGCVGEPRDETLTEFQALKVTDRTPEVAALYSLDKGRLAGCILPRVERACDSDYVSCVEDGAMVVQYKVGEECGVVHDGRLGVNFLLEAKTGNIISRYPEVPYFEDPLYCVDDYDCLCDSQGQSLANFVHAPLREEPFDECPEASCRKARCIFAGP